MTQDAPTDGDPEEPTLSLASDSPTTTGPTVASWPLDDLLQEPPPEVGPLVWRDPHPAFDNRGARERPSPAYYVSLTVAVLLVLGLVAVLAVLTVNRPVTRVTGSPVALNIPRLPPPTSSGPPDVTTTAAPPDGDYGELAEHPLSTSSATMPDVTCSLPTFDLADAAQETFYAAAKVCADNAFTGLLAAAGMSAAPVDVVTVHSGPTETPCGTVEPSSPATQCAGTVYMTPAHLRDAEANGRYPGRYLGVFLREYARAVQEAAGFGDLYEKAESAGASTEDIELRGTHQAICLAGIASSAMAGRGAVDGNITTEIRDRLTAVNAPEDAATWLDKGFQSRQPSACNAWV